MTKETVIKLCENLITKPDCWDEVMDLIDDISNGLYSEDGSCDYVSVVTLLEKLANQGCYNAMNRLGVIYSNGKIGEADLNLGIEWFEKANSGGLSIAKLNLACELLDENSPFKDYKRGLDLCIEAINENEYDAILQLANCYDGGLGVKRNLNYSFLLYQLALANGSYLIRKSTEYKLKLFTSDYIRPLKYIDFWPQSKYEGRKFCPMDMTDAVYESIDFDLPIDSWNLIEKVFSSGWNRNIGGYVNYEGLFSEIKGELSNKGLGRVLNNENLQKIYDTMIDFAQCTGCLILENRKKIFGDYEMDLIEYPCDAQLVTIISYASGNHAINYFNTVVSQLISHAKLSAVVWCRKNNKQSFANDISLQLFGVSDYSSYFSLAATEKDGIYKLACNESQSQIAELYLIDDEAMNVFDFCENVWVCRKTFETKYVFIEDFECLALPSEFMRLKQNLNLELAVSTLKALALSLDIPVVIQCSPTNGRRLFMDDPDIFSIPFRKEIAPMSDRIVVAYYDNIDGSSVKHLQVVKDNKNSTGKVIMSKC